MMAFNKVLLFLFMMVVLAVTLSGCAVTDLQDSLTNFANDLANNMSEALDAVAAAANSTTNSSA